MDSKTQLAVVLLSFNSSNIGKLNSWVSDGRTQLTVFTFSTSSAMTALLSEELSAEMSTVSAEDGV